MRDMAVARLRIYVKRDFEVSDKYRTIFHGKTKIKVGTYQYSFPICNFHKERVVSDFVKQYSKHIKYDFALNGYRCM